MKMFVKPLLLSTALVLLSGTASAQSAPIRLGQTTTMKLTEETDTRLAEQSTRIAELENIIQNLTGRMETLEFQLAQADRDRRDAETANASLTKRLSELEGRLDTLSASVRSRRTVIDPVTPDPDLSESDTITDKADDGPTDLRGASIRRKTTIINPDGTDSTNGMGTIPIDKLPADAGALIDLGKMRVLNRDYAGAVSALQTFETGFSDDPRVGEARYWLGEALYNTGDYAGSADYFTSVLRNHKDLPAYNDSYHKLARSLRMLNKQDNACKILALLDGDTSIDKSTRQRIINEKKESGCR